MAGDSDNEENYSAAEEVTRLCGAEGGLTLSYKTKL